MIFQHLFPDSSPHLDWIQVEISSTCNASCIYCPHSAFQANWQNRFLSLEAYRRLIPAFRKTNLVYLQGWGEPFLHPQFFEMLQIAKKAGCRVGTTTNGTLLNRGLIEKLIGQGLDVIGFSLAGVNERNDKFRKGTQIKKVLECMEEIHRAKAKYRAGNPVIHIAYMLLRSGFDDLEKLPQFLENTGVAQTVVSSLSYIVSPEMEKESLLATENKYLELKDRLFKVKSNAAKKNIELYFHTVSPIQNEFSCSENIPGAIVVGSNGSVSPCIIKQIPANRKNFYYINGQMCLQQNLSFGNIQKDSLPTIWHRKKYRQLLRDFHNRNGPQVCQNCLKKQIENY